ncbi:MAG: sugar transferase, partial [Caulobacterales bacterium]|nr:sugar transferase [Caulobacterales bacterium]
QMSLIGPRPHAIAHDIYYSGIIQNYDIRYLAKPGMSGLAQINGFRGPTEQIIKMENRIRKDCEYIENWSLKLDFKILIRTFFCLDSQNAV